MERFSEQTGEYAKIKLTDTNKKGVYTLNQLNPFNQFKNIYTPPGMMVYSLIERNGQTEFSFCIKEETRYIHKHKKPKVEVRMGIFEIGNVLIMPMMVQVNHDKDMLYETMFNYYQTSGGAMYLEPLTSQKEIMLLFYDEKNKEARRIVIRNTFQKSIRHFLKLLSETPSWSMSKFDEAKEKLYEDFPKPQDLWRELGKKSL